jgi:hypothetical protein
MMETGGVWSPIRHHPIHASKTKGASAAHRVSSPIAIRIPPRSQARLRLLLTLAEMAPTKTAIDVDVAAICCKPASCSDYPGRTTDVHQTQIRHDKRGTIECPIAYTTVAMRPQQAHIAPLDL